MTQLAIISVSNISEDQIREYREVFNLFDKDGGGSIDTDELGAVMRSLGQNPSEADLKEMVKQVDIDGNGTIDFEEFLGLMANKTDDIGTEEDIVKAFELFDKDHKGYFTLSEMRSVLANPGEKNVDEDVNEMIRRADKGDGKIDYKEFVKIMMPK